MTSAASDSLPASQRAVTRAVAVSRSEAHICMVSFGVRTEWPSFRPASQIGYQIFDATSAMFLTPSCTRRTSRSLNGASSRRP